MIPPHDWHQDYRDVRSN